MDAKALPLPNVWSQGQLFDFSGLDGETSWEHPTTGITLGDKAGFEFKSQDTKALWVMVAVEGGIHTAPVAGGHPMVSSDLVDLIVFQREALCVQVAFMAWKRGAVLGRVTVKGRLAPASDLRIYLAGSSNAAVRIEPGNGRVLLTSVHEQAVLTGSLDEISVSGAGDEFGRPLSEALSFEEPAARQALIARLRLEPVDSETMQSLFQYAICPPAEIASGNTVPDFDAVYQAKLDYFRGLPRPAMNDDGKLRTFYKACSVLKCNIYSPEGIIKCRWTTPDKYPHRQMWLWDSAFQAIGYKHIDGSLGEDAIRAMLSMQAPDGYVPLCACPPNAECVIDEVRLTQPPTLAWAAWNVYGHTRNKEFLRYCLPRLSAFVEWLFRERDVNGNGLLEWYVRPHDKICPCGESGMDNSSRFMDGERNDAIDLNALTVNEIRHIELIAQELGEHGLDRLAHRRRRLTDLINEKLWDEQDGFYYDLRLNGARLKIRTISSFFTLTAGIPSREQAARLVDRLRDPRQFWSELPLRSLAADEPSFDRNMWRGPVWMNCNYLVMCGLKAYGYDDLAEAIARRAVDEIAKWYVKAGGIFEFYDDRGLSPLELPRKDAHGESTAAVLFDYGWSCALYVDLMMNVKDRRRHGNKGVQYDEHIQR